MLGAGHGEAQGMRDVAAIPLIVRQHAQDAAFLFVQRAREIGGQSNDEEAVGRRDQRLSAHLDGLVAAGRIGWETALDEARRIGGAGEWFVAAVLALSAGDDAELGGTLDEALAAGTRGERGLSGATAWTGADALKPQVRRWIVSTEPALRRLGLAALSHHRADPGQRLGPALADPDAGVRARAARLAGEIGRRDAVPVLRELVSGGEPSFRVNWALARLGDPAGATGLVALVASAPDDARAGQALDMALLALPPKAAQSELSRLLGRPATRPLAVSRSGVVGDASLLPWLVGEMRAPDTVAAAGQAFRDLFAIDVDDTDLFTEDPAALGPGFEAVEPGPLPRADRVAGWAGPDGVQEFRSMRSIYLGILRDGIRAPDRALGTWRHRRAHPAWV
jgi:uncharacterized protein (TIGR02270 family)